MYCKKSLILILLLVQMFLNLGLQAQNDLSLRHFNNCIENPKRNKLNEKKVINFIKKGGNVNVNLNDNNRLLSLSVRDEDYNLTKYLLDHGAKTDWESKSQHNSNAPLWKISKNNSADKTTRIRIINLLFSYKANPNPYVQIDGVKSIPS